MTSGYTKDMTYGPFEYFTIHSITLPVVKIRQKDHTSSAKF